MKLDVTLALQLIAAEKRFLPGEWQTVPIAATLLSGVSADHPHIDRIEAKVYISNGSNNKASFILLMRVPGDKQRWRIYALDWNPTAPHQNGLFPGHPDSGKLFRPGITHEHHIGARLRDENPDSFALTVRQDMHDYTSALAYFCDRMNIIRPPHLPEPSPQGKLL